MNKFQLHKLYIKKLFLYHDFLVRIVSYNEIKVYNNVQIIHLIVEFFEFFKLK